MFDNHVPNLSSDKSFATLVNCITEIRLKVGKSLVTKHSWLILVLSPYY